MAPETFSARAGTEALSRGLCAAFAAACGRTLRRESQPAVPAYAIPAHPQAAASECARALPPIFGSNRIDLSQHDLKFERGQLGRPDRGRMGRGLAGNDGRDGDYPVHLLPAVRRTRSRPDLRRADVRPRAALRLYAGCGLGLRRGVARDPETGAVVTYGDVRLTDELQYSVYNFEEADVARLWSTSIATRPRRRRCW